MVSGALNRRRSTVTDANQEANRLRMLKLREEHAGNQDRNYSHVFRKKTRYELWRLCAIMMGIEFAYSAETAFVSPILLSIGIKHENMTMIWGLSPLLGFFVAPLIGSLSDKCKLQLGRRRPIMLLLGTGLLCGLILAPYGKSFGELIGEGSVNSTEFSNNSTNATDVHVESNFHSASTFYWAVIFTVLGTILLDFNADNIQSPSRAYLLDMCIQEDHARALSTFSLMAGTGGCLGYGLGGINWEATFLSEYTGGDNVKTVFALVTAIFVITAIITLTSFREIPLKLLESDDLLRPLTQAAMKKENFRELEMIEAETLLQRNGQLQQPEVVVDEDDDGEGNVTFGQYLKSVVVMPKSMKILCLTNLFCWMSHLCYCLYFTDFVGEAVFHGNPTAPEHSAEFKLYDEGVRFGCWGMSIYALSCAIYATVIERLINRFRAKKVFIGGMLIYGIGIGILAYWPTKWGVLVFSITAGITYGTVFTIPFLLVANYHGKGSFKKAKNDNLEANCNDDHGRGLGTDIAIVGSMLFLGQIFVSLSVGWFVHWLGTTAAVLYAASLFALLASFSANFCLYMDL